jgi:hypothetical protein
MRRKNAAGISLAIAIILSMINLAPVAVPPSLR